MAKIDVTRKNFSDFIDVAGKYLGLEPRQIGGLKFIGGLVFELPDLDEEQAKKGQDGKG